MKVYDKDRKGREVVRISINNKEDYNKNMGKTASFIIKALVYENKEVYVKFVSSTKKLADISLRTQKMLIILNRMMEEGLETAFGMEVPAEYRHKRMRILTSLPYVKKTNLNKVIVDDNGGVTKIESEIEDGFEPKATIIKLFLAEED